MNAHNEQNGRHPNFSVQSVAPSDPRLRNLSSSDHDKVCRDYVWGICNKHGHCKYRHECTLDEMKAIIRFCHDHQNRTGCLRPDCTYLHTSSEEENLFLTTGKLPRVLFERHAAMNAAAVTAGNVGAIENAPPVYVAQPPPPPPPPLTVAAPPPPPPPQPLPTVMPPPPPPPTTDFPTLHPVSPAALYTAPPPQPPSSFPINQPPPPLPIFDASRPPPPIPAGIRSGPAKRTMADACEAGPSKQRKPDDTKVAEIMCEMCLQRELSRKLCSEELEDLIRQREYKKLLFKSKTTESENLKSMMRLFLPAETYLAMEQYIDGAHSPPLGLSMPMQLMMSRLFEDRLSNSNNLLDSMPSSSMRELFLGYLLNSNASPERPASIDLRPSEILSASDILRSSAANIATNGFSRLGAGQRSAEAAGPAPPATLAPALPPAPAPAPAAARPAYSSTAAAPAPPPYPPPYQPAVPPPYQPAVPPPAARPAYPAFAPPGPAAQYPSARPAGPQAPAGPSAPAPAPAPPAPPAPVAPLNGHSYGQFAMGGYHSSHYYPHFQ